MEARSQVFRWQAASNPTRKDPCMHGVGVPASRLHLVQIVQHVVMNGDAIAVSHTRLTIIVQEVKRSQNRTPQSHFNPT